VLESERVDFRKRVVFMERLFFSTAVFDSPKPVENSRGAVNPADVFVIFLQVF
jgi:hypothetical protein